jgi:hypothetical protein
MRESSRRIMESMEGKTFKKRLTQDAVDFNEWYMTKISLVDLFIMLKQVSIELLRRLIQ